MTQITRRLRLIGRVVLLAAMLPYVATAGLSGFWAVIMIQSFVVSTMVFAHDLTTALAGLMVLLLFHSYVFAVIGQANRIGRAVLRTALSNSCPICSAAHHPGPDVTQGQPQSFHV